MMEKSIRCSAKRSAYSDRPSEASHSLTDGIALRVPLRECLGAAGPAPQRIARGQETAAVQDFDLAYVRFGSFSTDTPEAAGPFASAPPIPTTNSRHWCLLAAPRNELLHCETDLQDLAVRVLRAGDHQADGCGAGLMAWN